MNGMDNGGKRGGLNSSWTPRHTGDDMPTFPTAILIKVTPEVIDFLYILFYSLMIPCQTLLASNLSRRST